MVHFIPLGQRRLAVLAAQADSAPVLIHGSSGTGKGAISKWIHDNGPRATLSLVTAGRGSPLVEQIAQAQGGTLVIPEIGEWSRSEQKILLDYLNTKSIPHPRGNGTTMLLNVRIIATTSQSLEGRAQAGLFNSELLKKLNVFRIEMPELKRRKEEFNDIVLGILGEITREIHKEHLRTLSPDAWKKLEDYDWPGNLRELRNVLRLSAISAQGDRIEMRDLPDFGHHRVDFRATREEFEKIYILELLNRFDWRIEETCKNSQIDKNVLLAKMQKYGIEQASQSTSVS